MQATQTTTQKLTNVIKITLNQLVTLLMTVTKSTICNITYVVDDNRSKTIQGKKQIQKRVQITHVYLNHDYTNKVKNLTGNENFVAEPLKGKTRICSTLLQSDKTGEFMIDGKILKSETVEVLCYLHNGIEITEEEAILKDLWTPAYYKPTEKTTMGRGEVSEEDDFAIINTYLSRIETLKLQGEWYSVTA